MFVVLFAVSEALAATSPCKNFELVPKQGWGARGPKKVLPRFSGKVSLVFVHHTEGSFCTDKKTCSQQAKNVQNYHMFNKGRMYDDIGYSFLIGEDGRVYEGRGWKVVGGHTYGYNSNSYAVSLIGNFKKRSPNAASMNTLKNFIACAVEKGFITYNYELFGHRQAACTDCPGDYLFNYIKGLPRYSTRNITKYCNKKRLN